MSVKRYLHTYRKTPYAPYVEHGPYVTNEDYEELEAKYEALKVAARAALAKYRRGYPIDSVSIQETDLVFEALSTLLAQEIEQ